MTGPQLPEFLRPADFAGGQLVDGGLAAAVVGGREAARLAAGARRRAFEPAPTALLGAGAGFAGAGGGGVGGQGEGGAVGRAEECCIRFQEMLLGKR